MKIAPLCVNNCRQSAKATGFKGENSFHTNKSPKKKVTFSPLERNIILIGTIAAASISAALTTDRLKDNSVNDFMDKAIERYNKGDIKQDTFSIRDLTGDGIPDIEMFRNDGRNIILDVSKQDILE